MFSREQMQRAIEDALKQMEGVALELYRRGREEAREEIETVKRERDEARAEVERLRTALLEVQTSESAPAWFADGFHDGWKAGAEAMREACADMVRSEMTTGLLTPANVAQVVKMLATMPIPEEP